MATTSLFGRRIMYIMMEGDGVGDRRRLSGQTSKKDFVESIETHSENVIRLFSKCCTM